MPRLESVWLGSAIRYTSSSEWGKKKSLLITHAQDGIMPSCWENSKGGSGGSKPTYLKVTFTSASEGLNSLMDPGRVCCRNGARIQSNTRACWVCPWQQRRSRRFLRKHQRLPMINNIVILSKGCSALCGQWWQERFTSEISLTWSMPSNVLRMCECATRQSKRIRSLTRQITFPTHPRNDSHRALCSPYDMSGTVKWIFFSRFTVPLHPQTTATLPQSNGSDQMYQ